LDEALALPSEEAVKIALRTQQILAYETGVADVIDPLAGSYFVEFLTNRFEEECGRIFEEIEKRGGMIAAIEQGYPQREIARAAYEFQKDVEEKRYIVVGVNDYVEPQERPIPILKIDPAVEREQIERVRAVRARRDGAAAARALEGIRAAARGGGNLMPRFLEAARAGVTLGEMVDVLRAEFGEWREPPTYW
jgi:methylmalonyl-CoA mutase N-terminal domain/subunit